MTEIFFPIRGHRRVQNIKCYFTLIGRVPVTDQLVKCKQKFLFTNLLVFDLQWAGTGSRKAKGTCDTRVQPAAFV